MCENCKPESIELVMMVKTRSGQMEVPLRILSNLDNAKVDAEGMTVNGMDCTLNVGNYKFVKSFLIAALGAVEDAKEQHDKMPSMSVLRSIRERLKGQTLEELDALLVARQERKKETLQ